MRLGRTLEMGSGNRMSIGIFFYFFQEENRSFFAGELFLNCFYFLKNDRGVDHHGEGGVGVRMCIARRHPNSTVSFFTR